ncbi:hypothetical protein [Haloquadratum walsbyi]|nr:hypothetical protein [Haloquadratum walsbyi]
MISDVQRANIHPASFFKDSINTNADADTNTGKLSLLRPALVVAAVAVIGLLGVIPTLLAVAEAAPGGAGILFVVTSIIGSLVGTLGPFISWLIVGGSFFSWLARVWR